MFVGKAKGFKYPDVELVRWFFKHKMNELKNKKVLEFGCHNGNNLSLFASFDYECLGVELEQKNIDNANYNFKELEKYEKCAFYKDSIQHFAASQRGIEADVFLIPNVINFLTKEEFITLLKNARENRIYRHGGGRLSESERESKSDGKSSERDLNENKAKNDEKSQNFAHFFLRARSIKDHRYGLGKKLENGSFVLDTDEFSGEKGLICTAYQEFELVEILQKYLNLHDFEVLTSENINVKDKVFIKDSDIIVYGKIN